MTAATPPNDIQAEAGVLGSMMLSRNAMAVAIGQLREPDFYRGTHRRIFAAIVELHTLGQPVDEITVVDQLDRTGQLESVGGPVTITDLTAGVPTPTAVGSYARIVAEKAAQRRLHDLATDIDRRTGTEPATDTASWAIRQLEQAGQTGTTLRVLEGDQINQLADPLWLIDGILPEGLSVLFGDPGAGKSFIALSWACSLATRRAWFDRPVTSCPVLYIAAEGAAGIKMRRRAWQQANHNPPIDHLAVIPHPVDPTDAAQAAALTQVCERLHVGLVIWDTLARNMVGEENATDDMKRFVAALDRLRDRTAASQLVVHHSGKDGTIRGNTALKGAADGVFHVSQNETRTIQLACHKAKDALPAPPTDFQLAKTFGSAVLQKVATARTSAAALLGPGSAA